MAESEKSNLIEIPYVKLSDGNKCPLIGYGTSEVLGNNLGDPGYEAIKTAIRCGYRFIDTAAFYHNEEAVGSAIKECLDVNLVKREELFICTKLWCTSHKRESVMKACQDSLKRLGLSYVDLYLIHWPFAYAEDHDTYEPRDPKTNRIIYGDTHYTETWRGMEDVKEAGLAMSIGVSNFNHEMIDNILAMPCKYKPVINQIESHPYLSQERLLSYSEGVSIVLTAYCPLGSPGFLKKPDQPNILEDSTVKELAIKYNKSTAQILLRYQVQRGISAIPKSLNEKRIRENMDVFSFELTKEDIDRLSSLNRNLRYCKGADKHEVDDHPLYPFNIEY